MIPVSVTMLPIFGTGLRKRSTKLPHIKISGCKSHEAHLLCKFHQYAYLIANKKLIVKKIKKFHRLNSVFMQMQRQKDFNVILKIPPEIRGGYCRMCSVNIFSQGILLLPIAKHMPKHVSNGNLCDDFMVESFGY